MITAPQASSLAQDAINNTPLQQELEQLLNRAGDHIKLAAQAVLRKLIIERKFIVHDDVIPLLDRSLRQYGYTTNLTHTEFIITWP